VVEAAAFSPDGKTLLTGSADGTAHLWDVATGTPLGQPLLHQGIIRALAFSPDGKTVLTGSWDKTARLWDAATGQPRSPMLMHPPPGRAVSFHPTQPLFLTQTFDGDSRTGESQWWDAKGKPHGRPWPSKEYMPRVIVRPDGKDLLTGAVGYDRTVWLRDDHTG